MALVSLGLSEFIYRCGQETDTPSWFAEDWGDEAESEWAQLTPQGRIDKCLNKFNSGWEGSGYAFQQSDWMKDTTHHAKGHDHHHGHGC